MRLLVGSLVGLLVGKSYHTKQKDGYSLPTYDPTNNHINLDEQKGLNQACYVRTENKQISTFPNPPSP